MTTTTLSTSIASIASTMPTGGTAYKYSPAEGKVQSMPAGMTRDMLLPWDEGFSTPVGWGGTTQPLACVAVCFIAGVLTESRDFQLSVSSYKAKEGKVGNVAIGTGGILAPDSTLLMEAYLSEKGGIKYRPFLSRAASKKNDLKPSKKVRFSFSTNPAKNGHFQREILEMVDKACYNLSEGPVLLKVVTEVTSFRFVNKDRYVGTATCGRTSFSGKRLPKLEGYKPITAVQAPAKKLVSTLSSAILAS